MCNQRQSQPSQLCSKCWSVIDLVIRLCAKVCRSGPLSHLTAWDIICDPAPAWGGRRCDWLKAEETRGVMKLEEFIRHNFLLNFQFQPLDSHFTLEFVFAWRRSLPTVWTLSQSQLGDQTLLKMKLFYKFVFVYAGVFSRHFCFSPNTITLHTTQRT